MIREDEVIHYTEESWKAFKDSVWKEAQNQQKNILKEVFDKYMDNKISKEELNFFFKLK